MTEKTQRDTKVLDEFLREVVDVNRCQLLRIVLNKDVKLILDEDTSEFVVEDKEKGDLPFLYGFEGLYLGFNAYGATRYEAFANFSDQSHDINYKINIEHIVHFEILP